MGGFLFLLLLVSVAIIVYRIIYTDNKKTNQQQAHANFTYQVSVSDHHQLKEYETPKYIFEPTEVNKKIMRAMLYLAKADGQMRQEELDIIANFLIRMQPEHKDTYIYWLTDRIKELKPYTTDEYHNFLRQLDKSSLENLMTWMKSIFNTQKKNHPYEDILLYELQQAIDKVEQ